MNRVSKPERLRKPIEPVRTELGVQVLRHPPMIDIDWNQRVVIELLDESDNVLERHEGPTLLERKMAHDAGHCDSMCSFCYDEGCKFLDGMEEHALASNELLNKLVDEMENRGKIPS